MCTMYLLSSLFLILIKFGDTQENFSTTPETTTEPEFSTEILETTTIRHCLKTVNYTTDTSPFNITLSWINPCPAQYLVFLNSEKIYTTNNTHYTITNLNACQTYIVGVAIDEKPLGKPTEKVVKTPPPKPFKFVPKLTITETEYNLNISWLIHEKIKKCISSYNITWSTSKELNFVQTTNNFHKIHSVSCESYLFEITPVGEEIWGNFTLFQYNTSAFSPKPPEKVNVSVKKTSALITWQVNNTGNLCKITRFSVICNALSSENLGKDWIYKSRKKNVNSDLNSENITILLDDLSEFTNYTCYGIAENQGGKSNKSEFVKFQTDQEIPTVPKLLNLTVSFSSIHIKWDEPEKNPGILLGYGLHLKSVNPLHFIQPEYVETTDEYVKLNLDVNDYSFQDLHPDYNYSITIFAINTAGNGTFLTEYLKTKTANPEKPTNLTSETFMNITRESYKVTEKISWLLPENTNGPLKHFKICVLHHYNESLDIPENSCFYKGRNMNDSNIFYEHNLTNIAPSNEYLVEISAVLEDGKEGESSVISFTSPISFPKAPVLANISNITEIGFKICWREPEGQFGKITGFQLIIQSLRPLHIVPSDCKLKKYVFSYYSEKKCFQFTNGAPNYKYSVLLSAETIAGFGQNATEKIVQTKETKSEPVRNVKIIENYSENDTYKGEVTLKFDFPCNVNGPLIYFQVSYTGKRAQFPLVFNTKNVTNPFSFDLKPDYDYSLTISIITNYNTSKTVEFHSQAGVPILKRRLKPPKINATTKAYFQFTNDSFSSENGQILYYALFVMLPQNLSEYYGFWGLEWPLNNPEMRQITENYWNPFKNNLTEIVVEIGKEENCTREICNKLLKANTEYALILRALTNTTFRDSFPIIFRTDKEIGLNLILILGLIIGIVVATFFSVLIVISWQKQKMQIKKESICAIDSIPVSVNLKKFPSHYQYLKENYEIIKTQFTILDTNSKELILPSLFAVLPENKRKNRYTNILPYDETRVTLKIDEDDEIGSDYINASFIRGYSGKIEYIATQGPLQTTAKDFWKMVVQENITVIVMVSQFVEQNKEKCYKYFPNNHENMKFCDNLEVRCSTELHFGIYCVRTLQVKKDTVQRTIIHVQYMEWPDFGVPSGTENMLQFCQQIRDRIKTEGGIIAVHCSAGVGRTGTLIATDILLQTIEHGYDVNIFKTVLELRKQRTNMVQTDKQYMYIHTCIKDALENPIRMNFVKKSEPLYENLNSLRSSFEYKLLPIELESAL